MNFVDTMHSSSSYLSRVPILHVPQKAAQVTSNRYRQSSNKEVNSATKTVRRTTSLGLLHSPMDTERMQIHI